MSRLYPVLPRIWYVRGKLAEATELLDGAIEAGRKLVALEPDEPLGHTSLSMFYQRKGMIPEAEGEKAIASRLTMRRGA